MNLTSEDREVLAQGLKATRALSKIVALLKKSRKFGIWLSPPVDVLNELHKILLDWDKEYREDAN